jgi:PPOX class probable F420-dependent enzyme
MLRFTRVANLFTEKEAEFLNSQRVARLATLSKDGAVHLIPICYVFDGETIFFVTTEGMKKLRNIRRNANVSVVVDEYDEDWGNLKGLYIEGAANVSENREKKYGREIFNRKYPQELKWPPETWGPVVKITPKKIVSWGLDKKFSEAYCALEEKVRQLTPLNSSGNPP